MGRLCFPKAIQIVDFYHALEHAGKVLVALLGSKEHPEYKTRLGRWAKRLLKDTGFPIVLSKPFGTDTPSHQCGTARFGTDPATSVLDAHCRAWDHDNLLHPRGKGRQFLRLVGKGA